MLLATLLILAWPSFAHAQFAGDCPGFSPTGYTSDGDADRFYGERAVTILRAAMSRDRAGLEALVSPAATASISHGDTGWTPRSPRRGTPDLTGADAMIALVELLRPRAYTLTVVQPGPISTENPKRCGRSVSLLIAMTEPGQATSLEFTFWDGKLERVEGNQRGLVEGKLP